MIVLNLQQLSMHNKSPLEHIQTKHRYSAHSLTYRNTVQVEVFDNPLCTQNLRYRMSGHTHYHKPVVVRYIYMDLQTKQKENRSNDVMEILLSYNSLQFFLRTHFPLSLRRNPLSQTHICRAKNGQTWNTPTYFICSVEHKLLSQPAMPVPLPQCSCFGHPPGQPDSTTTESQGTQRPTKQSARIEYAVTDCILVLKRTVFRLRTGYR